MTISKIITSAAMVAVLGLAGGSAYAQDVDSHINDEGFTVAANANTTGTVFVHTGDSDVDEGEIFSTDGFEVANLPEHILETLEIE